ncbi:MAG: hypothetical protein U1F14_11760 [Steroidobacteraceae bacterium]
MNRGVLVAVVVAVLVAAAGFGAWRAWESGLIGSNPRAPVASAMEKSTRIQALVNSMSRGPGEDRCLQLELRSPEPELSGAPGIAQAFAPGQFGVLLLRNVDSRHQDKRERQIRQLDFLAREGLLTRVEIDVDSPTGPLAAVRYGLSWDGYSAARHSYGTNLCLDSGQREFAGIELIEPTLEKVMDHDVYDVTYRTTVAGIPAWATKAEAAKLFPQLGTLIEDRTGHAKLVRTPEGWRSSYEIEMEASATGSGTQRAEALALMSRLLFAEPPEAAAVARLFDDKLRDEGWMERHGTACLPLQLLRGGDVPAQRDAASPFTITYLDRPDRPRYELPRVTTTLHVLAALESAGLARGEYLEPSGVRYRVSDEAVAALDLNGGRGCVPAGRLAVELLRTRTDLGSVQISARASVSNTPGWVLDLARHLPALRTVIESGMPMTGMLSTLSPKGETELEWRSDGVDPRYPQPSYQSLPAHLLPVMPATAALLRAASTTRPLPLLSGGRVEPARRPPPIPEPSIAARSEPSVAPAGPPFPADGSPVHVISVYEGQLPPGVERQFQQQVEGITQVRVLAAGATLLLASYEAMEWRIDAPRGIGLRRIIAMGYYDQRVKVSGGGRPEVVTGKLATLLKNPPPGMPDGLPTQTDGNSLVDVANISRALTGDAPESFQAAYTTPAGGFVVAPGTARFELPQATAPGSTRGPVGFRDLDNTRGLEVLRGPAGPFTDVTADRSYSAGRVYFEGEMRVTGSVSAHDYSNIGVCLDRDSTRKSRHTLAIRRGEQKLHTDGDVFGVAADFDNGRVYHRVNGRWINGAPGTAGGTPLERGKWYRACFFTSGTTAGSTPRSDTTWRANFGSHPFAYPAPAGYVPYE